MRVLHENVLFLAAQRPNMAVLSESEVKAKFTRILRDSVKC